MRTVRHEIATAGMLSAVRGKRGRSLPGVRSTKPIVHNFRSVHLLHFSLENFFYIFTGISFTFPQVF